MARNIRGRLVRPVLQNVSIRYQNDDFVADQVFPIIDGLDRKVKIAKGIRGGWLRSNAKERAPGTPATRSYTDVTTQNLDPINYAHSTNVPDEDIENYNAGGNVYVDDPAVEAIELNAQMLDLRREIDVVAAIQAASWNSLSAGGEDAEGHWGDTTAADDTFVADILRAQVTSLKKTGKMLNTMVFDPTAWFKLIQGPALVGKINPSAMPRFDLAIAMLKNGQVIPEDMFDTTTISNLIKIPNIIIAKAIVNTATEAEDESDNFTPGWIWKTATGDKGQCFVYHRPPNPGRKQVSAGYQYRVIKGSGVVRENRTWYEDAEHAQAYDAQEEVDIAAVALDAAWLFKDTATT